MRFRTVAAASGIAGPVLFTAAWAISLLRQRGHPAAELQLSGLAAEDARDPQIMIAGFVVLGVTSIVFGAGLGRVIGPRSAGARLIIVAGAATIALGVFRRDHLLLTSPGFTGESWHNQVHDVVSGVAYAAMLAAPVVLGRRFRADPDWAALTRPVEALTLGSAVAFAIFVSRVTEPQNGLVQRIAVTLPLIAEAVIAARMLTLRRVPSPSPTGTTSPSATGTDGHHQPS
ncbi:MAG: DUF998 domain-containing protein [Streptosporangiaceae bacterium]